MTVGLSPLSAAPIRSTFHESLISRSWQARDTRGEVVPLEGLEPDMHPFGGAGEGQEPSVLLGFLALRDHCDHTALFQVQSKCSQKWLPLSVSERSPYFHLARYV